MRGPLPGKVHGQRISNAQKTPMWSSSAKPSLLAGSRYLDSWLFGTRGQDGPRLQSCRLTAMPRRRGNKRLSLRSSMSQPLAMWTLVQEDVLPLRH
jgi:hypothetical protein